MTPDFVESIVYLVKNKTLSISHARQWVTTRNQSGLITNLDYIELMDALNEYDKHNETRTQSI